MGLLNRPDKILLTFEQFYPLFKVDKVIIAFLIELDHQSTGFIQQKAMHLLVTRLSFVLNLQQQLFDVYLPLYKKFLKTPEGL